MNILFSSTTKKTRSLRTTTTQSEELVKYMESHSEFASNKFITKEGKIHHMKQWEELTTMLNALCNGPGKTVKQWQTVSTFCMYNVYMYAYMQAHVYVMYT